MVKPIANQIKHLVFYNTNYVLLNKWLRHLIVPLAILTVYFIAFYYFIPLFIPEYRNCVNYHFVRIAFKGSLLLLILSVGLYFVFIIFTKIKKLNTPKLNNWIEKVFSSEKFYISDFLLILLPLTPVIQYIINNQDILPMTDSLYVFLIFFIFSAIFIYVIPVLVGLIGSAKMLMILGLTFTYTIINMAFLSSEFRWFEEGDFWIQLSVFVVIFLVSWTLYNPIGRKALYLIVIAFFIANTAMQVSTLDVKKIDSDNDTNVEKFNNIIASDTLLSTPNIYLLLYDAYVINETMIGYGINNSNQEKYLESLGFIIYPHTYSIGCTSIDTMSRVLNASTEFYGYSRKGVSGDGTIHHLLKNFGYDTHGVFTCDYYFQGIGSSYDYSLPETLNNSNSNYSSCLLLVKSVFMGEFRFDVEFGNISREQFLKYKLELFSNIEDKPRFVYMHTNKPLHSQNSGSCLPNEVSLYEERLFEANEEMKRDIQTLIGNDPSAIIIISGDHGPYLTKNCTSTKKDYDISKITRLDIQDRFGTFLAIKWPTDDYSNYDNITVIQDLFPSILSYLFKNDKFLELKVPSETVMNYCISGASVKKGIIQGGINDGEPLFISSR